MEVILKVINTDPGVSQLLVEPSLPSEEYIERACPGTLRRGDMVALFVVILFFITNVPSAVAGGAAGLALWLIGGIGFLLPCAIATAQLSVVYPYEGSVYIWTYKIFGSSMSFFVGFCAWVPGPLIILATADLVVTYLQGINPGWLVAPWQQGVALLVIILSSYILSLRRQRMIQYIVNVVCILSLLAAVLVCLAGVVWLLTNHASATDFSQLLNWNPFTATNVPLFGVITLGYLGVNLPLNMGGELAGSDRQVKKRIITGHLLWGTVIVLLAYLLATFGVLVVQGSSAGYALFDLVTTVKMALGPIAAVVVTVCIICTFLFATAVYNFIFARFLLVGGVDQRIPSGMGRLNANRVPGRALLFQTCLACLLAIILFIVLPLTAIFPVQATKLATEVYYVGIGAATVLWAFATLFLFLNLFGLMFRHGEQLRKHRLFPLPVLFLSALLGLVLGGLAIVDTVLNSYYPPLLPNNMWWYLVLLLAGVFMIIGIIGCVFARSEAHWESLKDAQAFSSAEASRPH